MSAMVRKHEKNKTVATRHYFSLYIKLCENDDKFNIDTVDFQFAGSSDVIIADALQFSNNKLLSFEIPHIYKNLIKEGIKLNARQLVSLYTISALIKRYSGRGFKYVFIPVTLDYGRGGNIVHQTALLIDLSGKFIFYEPYGKYTKHNKSYKSAIQTLFSVFSNVYTVHMYHDLYKLPHGIQHIILKNNNKLYNEFDTEYELLLQQLKKRYPDTNFSYDKDEHDHTYNIINLLSTIDKFGDTDETYKKILDSVLMRYYEYNSKTCVSITLIEMNEFFEISTNYSPMNPIAEYSFISAKLTEYYSQFNVYKPNVVLMPKLNELINMFKYSNSVRKVIDSEINIFKICKKI
jgi:hypothetical protein